jgi:uncharacterized protein
LEENKDIESQNLWEHFFKKEWSYVTGAVILSLLAIALVIVTGSAWGVSGPFPIWGGKILSWLGINVDSWAAFNGSVGNFTFASSQASLTNLGIIIGALLSVLLAASFKFKKIRSKKQVGAAILGGLFMGIGARIALGCNIGGFFSSLPAFSLSGWVFMIFIFLGAAVGSIMLKKWFM